jgi:hypothetical protein
MLLNDVVSDSDRALPQAASCPPRVVANAAPWTYSIGGGMNPLHSCCHCYAGCNPESSQCKSRTVHVRPSHIRKLTSPARQTFRILNPDLRVTGRSPACPASGENCSWYGPVLRWAWRANHRNSTAARAVGRCVRSAYGNAPAD